MNNDINLKDIPYTQWLEETLRNIIELPVQGIYLHVVLDGGEVYSDHYNLNMTNKLAIAGLIQQEAMYDSLYLNGLIKPVDEEGTNDGEKED